MKEKIAVLDFIYDIREATYDTLLPQIIGAVITVADMTHVYMVSTAPRVSLSDIFATDGYCISTDFLQRTDKKQTLLLELVGDLKEMIEWTVKRLRCSDISIVTGWNLRFDLMSLINASKNADIDLKEMFKDGLHIVEGVGFRRHDPFNPLLVQCGESFSFVDYLPFFARATHHRLLSYQFVQIASKALGVVGLNTTARTGLKGLMAHRALMVDFYPEYVSIPIAQSILLLGLIDQHPMIERDGDLYVKEITQHPSEQAL